ncbi:MAG: pyruvate:ferredoxin (flavodoxin) oxidoreductase [Bacteroidota bacterium]
MSINENRSARKQVTIDGNEAAAYVAHKTNEVIAIYPITPSSNMGEWCDQWSAEGRKNIWGTVPIVTEMQSEGGAAGAVHGALQTGSLTTTFTASQGLLLMIPNMFKIAGELTSTVFHVSARAIAAQALSIFGDHSDVMATRSTGWGMLCSHNVQEVMDFALIAQAATLEGRVPILHFFDGFRTSHEVMKIEQLSDDDIRAMIDDELVAAHRRRALTPDNPVIRGTAQNPDVYFQGRETVNPFYEKMPEVVQKWMDTFATIVGRQYKLFDYFGAPDAERIVVLMGSGSEAVHETVEALMEKGEKIGVIKVHLYRPFSRQHLINALPASTKAIAVLDRTKEPGTSGEPLYLDVVAAINEYFADGNTKFASLPRIIGGRYGLASKEFTPAMAKAVFDELKKEKPKNHFTVGIIDDVSHTSLDVDYSFSTEKEDVFRGLFYGLGADGTVGANKNSIKIIGEETPYYGQGYFVYDSKKSGTTTVSHLRFGPRPIRSSYLITKANFVACHQWQFLEKMDMLSSLIDGGTFLINSPFGPDRVWDNLPRSVQETIIKKKLNLYVIDGTAVAQKTGMGGRVNTVMQTCFFAISGVLPKDQAIEAIKKSIKKTYGRKGEDIVKMNYAAVDATIDNLHKVDYPEKVTSTVDLRPPVPNHAPAFIKEVTGKIIAGEGDLIPVSAMPADGTYPVGTTKWEKRNIALEIPVWDAEWCIQCGKCALVCPHASIRIKVYDNALLADAPPTFKHMQYKGNEYKGQAYTIQVAPEDCTGCGLCVEVCPAKNKKETKYKALNMMPQPPLREQEAKNWDFFLTLPDVDRKTVAVNTIKGSQFLQPLFEFSGACTGCGETPYVKLVSQLFGDRAVIANATGCSSIYGGNLPTTPWTKNNEGRGPAWSNSLFEDNAEFGLGFRLSIDKQHEQARELLLRLIPQIGEELVNELLSSPQTNEEEIFYQRERVTRLKEALQKHPNNADARRLLEVADYLVQKSVWIMGGDGWAYDIGFGGLDHVLASGANVNILVLDTEVYSNTGGQMSKATPRGAVAKFAASGKPVGKKDLGLIAMSYGNVYVAQVAMGANDLHTVKAFLEAEAYNGPSLIIAYSHCIAHGINIRYGMDAQKKAVESGYWPLYRYNPQLAAEGKNPFQLDSKPPKIKFEEYAYNEIRYKMLTKMAPEKAKKLLREAQEDIAKKWRFYEHLAALNYAPPVQHTITNGH